MKIKWKNRRPMIAKYNIPVVMVRIVVPDPEYKLAGYTMCPAVSPKEFATSKTVQLSMVNQLSMRDGTFPDHKLTWKELKREYKIGELGSDCFDYETLKQSKDIKPKDFGKLGYCTDANTRAVPFDGEFIRKDKGTLPYHVVYMYGYIPEGAKYFIANVKNGYYPKVKRYISEQVVYLSINDHKKITELTGYTELFNFIN